MVGLMKVSVGDERVTAHYTAEKTDGIYFATIREVTRDGVPIDDRLTTGDEIEIRKQIEEHLNRGMINES